MTATLPAEPFHPIASSAGVPGAASCLGEGLAALETPVEWMRPCEVCGVEQCFVAEYVLLNGLFARCSKCGNEVVAAFTRTVGEAA